VLGVEVSKAEVEVEAYTTCSPNTPASWLSAARCIANRHFILESAIHIPNKAKAEVKVKA
jgi:hypothetical protein